MLVQTRFIRVKPLLAKMCVSVLAGPDLRLRWMDSRQKKAEMTVLGKRAYGGNWETRMTVIRKCGNDDNQEHGISDN